MSTTTLPSNQDWLRRITTGQPHQIIGGADDPYMLRWYLIPRNRALNVYLHKFMRDDDDRALHDHPWWFVSVILRGGYIEHTESPEGRMVLRCRTSVFHVRSPWWRRSIGFRPAVWQHRVALPHTPDGGRVPCWTLIVTGRNVRTWGFWCPGPTRRAPKRFVPWREFGDAGCGEAA